MTKSQIFTAAHQVRKSTGCSMSLALRQVYAARRACGFAVGKSERNTDLCAWLVSMTRKGALADYAIPTV